MQLLAWIQQDNVDAARYGTLQKKTRLQQRPRPQADAGMAGEVLTLFLSINRKFDP